MLRGRLLRRQPAQPLRGSSQGPRTAAHVPRKGLCKPSGGQSKHLWSRVRAPPAGCFAGRRGWTWGAQTVGTSYAGGGGRRRTGLCSQPFGKGAGRPQGEQSTCSSPSSATSGAAQASGCRLSRRILRCSASAADRRAPHSKLCSSSLGVQLLQLCARPHGASLWQPPCSKSKYPWTQAGRVSTTEARRAGCCVQQPTSRCFASGA